MYWIPIGFAIYAMLLGFLLYIAMDDQRKRRFYTGSKMAVSTAFLLIYLVTWLATDRILPQGAGEASVPADAMEMAGRASLGLRPGFLMLFLPLLLCWTGDLLLGLYQQKFPHGRRLKRFLAGALALFGAAHVLFLRFIGWFGLPWSAVDLLLTLLGAGAGIAASLAGRMRMGRMRIPAYLYAVLISLLMARGVHLRTAVAGAPTRAFASGTMYFFLSDFLILFLYFYRFRNRRAKKVLHAANLVTYYMGIFGMILGAVLL